MTQMTQEKKHLNEQLLQNFISAKSNTNTMEHESNKFNDSQSTKCQRHLLGLLVCKFYPVIQLIT